MNNPHFQSVTIKINHCLGISSIHDYTPQLCFQRSHYCCNRAHQILQWYSFSYIYVVKDQIYMFENDNLLYNQHPSIRHNLWRSNFPRKCSSSLVNKQSNVNLKVEPPTQHDFHQQWPIAINNVLETQWVSLSMKTSHPYYK